MMLQTKYQSQGPLLLDKKIFKDFSLYESIKNKLPQGYNLNNLGRGSLDDATYQISKAWAFYLQTIRFFKFWLISPFLLP